MNTIVIALEGVLCGKSDNVVLTQEGPTDIAAVLYGSFARTCRVVLATKYDRTLVDHWCRQFGFTHHQTVEKLDSRTVARLRAAGSTVDLYIDHDADRLQRVNELAVPTLKYTRQPYQRERVTTTSFGQRSKPWAQVVAESRAQREARPSVVADD